MVQGLGQNQVDDLKLTEAIIAATLNKGKEPLSFEGLRLSTGMHRSTLRKRLLSLVRAGIVIKTKNPDRTPYNPTHFFYSLDLSRHATRVILTNYARSDSLRKRDLIERRRRMLREAKDHLKQWKKLLKKNELVREWISDPDEDYLVNVMARKYEVIYPESVETIGCLIMNRLKKLGLDEDTLSICWNALYSRYKDKESYAQCVEGYAGFQCLSCSSWSVTEFDERSGFKCWECHKCGSIMRKDIKPPSS